MRAVLLVVGVLVALQAIGFDLTLLTVFGGALGVGIGLGLQKLAANYIAGFTILLDRSIRLGDMITVDGRYGVVSRVTSRYVVVRSLDGIEAIVPNETLVTTTVLNHSYTAPEIRIGDRRSRSPTTADVELALRAHGRGRARRAARAARRPTPPTAFVVELRRQRHRPRTGLLGRAIRKTARARCKARSTAAFSRRSGETASRSPTRGATCALIRHSVPRAAAARRDSRLSAPTRLAVRRLMPDRLTPVMARADAAVAYNAGLALPYRRASGPRARHIIMDNQ